MSGVVTLVFSVSSDVMSSSLLTKILPLPPHTHHCWLLTSLTLVASYTHRPCLVSTASPGPGVAGLTCSQGQVTGDRAQPPALVSGGGAEIPQAAGASIVSQECTVQYLSFLEWLT